jgi:hypothetical protein
MKLIINYKKPIYKENKIIDFETKCRYNINLKKKSNVIGGDIFDDINIDDIIIKKEDNNKGTDKENISYKIKNLNKNYGDIDPKIIKKYKIKNNKKSDNMSEYNIDNIPFSIFNSLYDIKLLIYYIIDIPIENQNLYNKKDSSLFYEYTNIVTNELLDIDIKKIVNNTGIKYYNNIPIDFDIINNRFNYIINTYEKNKYLNELNTGTNYLNDHKELEFDLVILNDLILDLNILNHEIEKDNELLYFLYNGFIEKYFPYYDSNLFLLYLSNEKKTLEYPSLNIKKDNIINKNEKILNIVKENKKRDRLIPLITSYYKKLIYNINSFNNSKVLNIKELFNNIEIKKIDNVKKLELQLEIHNKFIYFSKHNIVNYAKKENEYQNLNSNNQYDSKNLFINNKDYNSLIGTSHLSNNIILIVYYINETDTNIYIIINEYFEIYIIYNIDEYEQSSNSSKSNELDLYEFYVIKYVNIFLKDLFKNSLIKEKKQINKYNIELQFFDKQLIFNQNISSNIFDKLYSELLNYENIDFYNIINTDEVNNVIELSIKKIKYDLLKDNINLSDHTNNYYNYYIKYELTDKYNKLLYLSKVILVNRITNLKIDILNINKEEMNDLTHLLFFILSNVLEIDNKKIINKNDKLKSQNKLKKLKEIDPILYSINKKNTQNLYSRKCQAAQQPDIIDYKDLKKYKKHLKYINFTTGKPIYYTCNNKKFPNVKFLTNLHPKNYCIPCCKKKAIDDVKVKSKYTEIHNECLTTYKYDKKNKLVDEKSRYIMNYSSKTIIENLRLMHIPDILFKLFNKSIEYNDSDIDLKYYILGLNQNVNNIENVGTLSILSFMLNKNINDTINIIKDLFTSNPNLITHILNGKLLNYFNTTKDFLVVLSNIFQDKILLPDLNFEFNEWNEFFIELCKYLGYIGIIFEESDNEISSDNSTPLLNLNLPPNIKQINEYIYNNNKFNYILILKRNYKNKIIYYPIIKTNYLEYYANNTFYNKFYNYENQIIKLITEIIKTNLASSKNSMNLNLIEEFILENNNYEIVTYFINNKYEIYSILLKYKNKAFLYFNIEKQKVLNDGYSKFNTIKFSNQYVNLNKISPAIQLNDIIIFIKDYNKYLYSKNKMHYSDMYYKSIINTINEKNINENIDKDSFFSNTVLDKLISYVYINNFILFNDKIIGVQIITDNSKKYNSYITKAIDESIGNKINNNKGKEIIKILQSKKISKEQIKSILTREFKNTHYTFIKYIYSPHDINKIIYSKKYIIDNRIKKLNESLYHTNLYNILLIHFTNKLFKLKNIYFRAKLKFLINNLILSDINLIITNQFHKITDLINKNIKINDTTKKTKILYNVTNFIKQIIIKNMVNIDKVTTKWINEIKSKIINNIDSTIFLFDNILIFNILEMDKNEAIKELDKIFKDIIINTNVNTNKDMIGLELCETIQDSYSCKNKKLIISKEIYKTLLDILYYDLTNPFKQKLILNLVNYNLNNIYQFKQYINEKIYIYI